MLGFLVSPPEKVQDAINQSRADAGAMLRDYAAGKLGEVGDVGRQFLEGPHRIALYRWSTGMDAHLQMSLFHDLLSYATSLLVMQRLEAKHHLVHVRVAASRAMGVALMSANLRRALHNDLHQETFRNNLSRFLNDFASLVDESWESFKELQSYTTGLHLQVMFADREQEQEQIVLADAQDGGNSRTFLDQLAHLLTVSSKGSIYAVPLPRLQQSRDGFTSYVVFKLLGFKPGARKYMQRLTRWAQDSWQGSLMAATLGCMSVQNTEEGTFARLPADASASFASSNVQSLLVSALFEDDRVDYMHEFGSVDHEVCFDAGALEDFVSTEGEEQLPIALVTLGVQPKLWKLSRVALAVSGT